MSSPVCTLLIVLKMQAWVLWPHPFWFEDLEFQCAAVFETAPGAITNPTCTWCNALFIHEQSYRPVLWPRHRYKQLTSSPLPLSHSPSPSPWRRKCCIPEASSADDTYGRNKNIRRYTHFPHYRGKTEDKDGHLHLLFCLQAQDSGLLTGKIRDKGLELRAGEETLRLLPSLF